MEINGLKLPSSFIKILQKGILRREIGSWKLREEVDAFGNKLESELGEVFDSEAKFIQETGNLSKHFVPDGYYGEQSDSQNAPGFIPDIINFSEIICFGIAGDGAPFCFDYRNNLESPSVIWWDDVYWRRIATNFETFIALFELSEDA